MRNLSLFAIFLVFLAGCADVGATVGDIGSKVSDLVSLKKPGQVTAVDRCLTPVWGAVLDAAPQQEKLEERIDTPSGEVLAFSYDRLAGEYAKLFLFARSNSGCYDKAFVVGSYQANNDSARAASGDDAVQVYHFELYTAEAQSSIALGIAKPDYENARNIALRHLK